MEIKVPQKLKDCTPAQLSKWVYLTGDGLDINSISKSLDFQVQVVSIFSGISKSKLYNLEVQPIRNVYDHMIKVLSEKSTLKGEITIDGQRYVFDKKFEHKSTGLIIDLKLIESIYDEPYKILSMLYIEEGLIYNQVDENDYIINPKDKRIKLFKEHFPGDEFLNVFAFFLDRWEKLKDAIWGLNMAMTDLQLTKMKKDLMKDLKEIPNGMIGRQTSSSLPKN